MKNPKVIAILGCLAAVVGSFLPWLSAQSIFGTLNVAGTEGDGIITLILGVLAAVLIYVGKTKLVLIEAQVCLIIGVIVVFLEFNHLNNKINTAPDEIVASVGYGLYVCAIGFMVAGAAALRMQKDLKLKKEVEEKSYAA